MKALNEIGLLLYPSIRGLMYLNAFIKNGVVPGVVVIQGAMPQGIFKNYTGDFWQRHSRYIDVNDFNDGIEDYLDSHGIESVQLSEASINSEALRKATLERPEQIFVFSGGGIVEQPLLDTRKRFIHIHPGILPDYRGSTCYYYSMLKDGRCGASAFFMERELDAGDLIGRKSFMSPSIDAVDWMFFDVIYDPWIRSELLYEIIRDYKNSGVFNAVPQDKDAGEMYFIIHPVLKHLAIKGRLRK